jgi:phosphopantothenoylcysteine decarboxylase/phosphopantothenate--cysteine ligase
MTNPFQGKNIMLGVTGSIAAYKAVDLASKLTQSGALVTVILTPAGEKFVSPLTFQSVTGRKAFTDTELWGGEGHVVHVGIGHTADLLVIAPATATTMAKLAHGIGDNLLTVSALAARCPLVIAPAMDSGMFTHPATSANVEILRQRGAIFIGPAEGHLASGLTGAGRFVEPVEVLGNLRWILSKNGPLAGKKVVVTAGGTQEPIDPVRIITNRSSGKQGYAVCQAALDSGAEVVLISSPVCLPVPIGARLIPVRTAAEMQDAVLTEVQNACALVMAAAVADFRPAKTAAQKIKKTSAVNSIPLEPTEDILELVARYKKKNGSPLRTIGFAAESQDLLANARVKLEKKNLDLIVANDISTRDAGFEVDTNRVTLLFADGQVEALDLQSKSEVAEHILQHLCTWLA